MKAKKTKTKALKPLVKSLQPTSYSSLDYYIETIAEKRIGGAVNFRGIGYQVLYACARILQELASTSSSTAIRLEGIEDVDVESTLTIGKSEYIQLKTSQNDLDASRFWQLGILQNFLEVYDATPNVSFRVVHNMRFSAGHLSNLARKEYSPATITYWKEKLQDFRGALTFDLQHFLERIVFENTSEFDLYEQCVQSLIANFQINLGAEEPFLKALFYSVFNWSKERATIVQADVAQLIQDVKDSYAKLPVNAAVKHNWVVPVDYKKTETPNDFGYFDGQAALPRHIAQGLPARRHEWETVIETHLVQSDVVLIKSSSGQGKSTLAWQVGQNLLSRGYLIYQMMRCDSWDQANSLLEFLQARVRLGELPLIVIDGLNAQVKEWYQLVEAAAELPVKFLITSREEDWYRYGADLARIRLQTVTINVSINEAENIYLQLKTRGKVNEGTGEWQSAWEAVAAQGLLIEYVYLLTQGQMIHDRLQVQVRNLNREKEDAAAKLEILRLVAVADTLNLKLATERLLKHVQRTIRFTSDRGEVLKQLEREYFLSFEGRQVEGLHPVRSKHLVALLHATVPLEDSLMGVFEMLPKEETYDFFIGAPSMLGGADRKRFYAQLAAQIAQGTFAEMVGALDGLMHSEPSRYLAANRPIFDEASKLGGLWLFAAQTLPFTKLDTIADLNKTMGGQFPNLGIYLGLLGQLSPYSMEKSDLMLFSQELHQHLVPRGVATSYEGLGYLSQWLVKLGLQLPALVSIEEEYVLKELREQPAQYSAELFQFFQLFDTTLYSTFIEHHKKDIIALLKIKTDSLTIEEVDDDIQLNYLLASDDAGNANEQSVTRLELINVFLPFYERYRSEAIVLPYPNREIHEAVIANSTKHMSKSAMRDKFDVHVNQIWVNTIEDMYRPSTVYEWQKRHYSLRQAAVEFTKNCIRLLEVGLEKNNGKIQSAINAVVEQGTALGPMLQQRPSPPRYSKRYFEAGKYRDQQRVIDEWMASMQNFTSQFSGLISPKGSNDRNLVRVNVRGIVFNLSKMQAGYREVAASTYPYFPLDDLEVEESTWYDRLLRTVLFYIHNVEKRQNERVYGARAAIIQWQAAIKREELHHVHRILNAYSVQNEVQLYLPDFLVESKLLKYAVIGVEGIAANNEEELLKLMMGLADLADTAPDFFTFFFIEHGQTFLGLRFQDHFFEKVKSWLRSDDEDFEIGSFSRPHPIIANDELIRPLAGVSVVKPVSNEVNNHVYSAVRELWELGEYRQRLDTSSVIERQWLDQKEAQSLAVITAQLSEMSQAMMTEKVRDFRNYCSYCLTAMTKISQSDLLVKLTEMIQG
jgi:hypothetical protein